jgi:hypothetical protein
MMGGTTGTCGFGSDESERKRANWKHRSNTLMIMELRIQLEERDIERARVLTGIQDPQELLPYVLKRFSQLEAGAQLAKMRGIDPTFEVPPRRRPDDPVTRPSPEQ